MLGFGQNFLRVCSLEADGVIMRAVFPEVLPKVEHALTE